MSPGGCRFCPPTSVTSARHAWQSVRARRDADTSSSAGADDRVREVKRGALSAMTPRPSAATLAAVRNLAEALATNGRPAIKTLELGALPIADLERRFDVAWIHAPA